MISPNSNTFFFPGIGNPHFQYTVSQSECLLIYCQKTHKVAGSILLIFGDTKGLVSVVVNISSRSLKTHQVNRIEVLATLSPSCLETFLRSIAIKKKLYYRGPFILGEAFNRECFNRIFEAKKGLQQRALEGKSLPRQVFVLDMMEQLDGSSLSFHRALCSLPKTLRVFPQSPHFVGQKNTWRFIQLFSRVRYIENIKTHLIITFENDFFDSFYCYSSKIKVRELYWEMTYLNFSQYLSRAKRVMESDEYSDLPQREKEKLEEELSLRSSKVFNLVIENFIEESSEEEAIREIPQIFTVSQTEGKWTSLAKKQKEALIDLWINVSTCEFLSKKELEEWQDRDEYFQELIRVLSDLEGSQENAKALFYSVYQKNWFDYINNYNFNSSQIDSIDYIQNLFLLFVEIEKGLEPNINEHLSTFPGYEKLIEIYRSNCRKEIKNTCIRLLNRSFSHQQIQNLLSFAYRNDSFRSLIREMDLRELLLKAVVDSRLPLYMENFQQFCEGFRILFGVSYEKRGEGFSNQEIVDSCLSRVIIDLERVDHKDSDRTQDLIDEAVTLLKVIGGDPSLEIDPKQKQILVIFWVKLDSTAYSRTNYRDWKNLEKVQELIQLLIPLEGSSKKAEKFLYSVCQMLILTSLNLSLEKLCGNEEPDQKIDLYKWESKIDGLERKKAKIEVFLKNGWIKSSRIESIEALFKEKSRSLLISQMKKITTKTELVECILLMKGSTCMRSVFQVYPDLKNLLFSLIQKTQVFSSAEVNIELLTVIHFLLGLDAERLKEEISNPIALRKSFNEKLKSLPLEQIPELLKLTTLFPEVTFDIGMLFENSKIVDGSAESTSSDACTLLDLFGLGPQAEEEALLPTKDEKARDYFYEFINSPQALATNKLAKMELLIEEVKKRKDPELISLLKKSLEERLKSPNIKELEFFLDCLKFFPELNLDFSVCEVALEKCVFSPKDVAGVQRLRDRLEEFSVKKGFQSEGSSSASLSSSFVERCQSASERALSHLTKACKKKETTKAPWQENIQMLPFSSGGIKEVFVGLSNKLAVYKTVRADKQSYRLTPVIERGVTHWLKLTEGQDLKNLRLMPICRVYLKREKNWLIIPSAASLSSLRSMEMIPVDKLSAEELWVEESFEAWGDFHSLLEKIAGCSLSLKEAERVYKALLVLLIPVLRAVQFTHDRCYVHFDIKPNNIQFCWEDLLVAKLADGDFARSKEEIDKKKDVFCGGTEGFTSPESSRKGFKELSYQDCYALGVTFMILSFAVYKNQKISKAKFQDFYDLIKVLVHKSSCPFKGDTAQGAGFVADKLEAMQDKGVLPSNEDAQRTLRFLM